MEQFEHEPRAIDRLPTDNPLRIKLERLFHFAEEGAEILKNNIRDKKESIPPRHFNAAEIAEMITDNLANRLMGDEARGMKVEAPFRLTNGQPVVERSQVHSWARSGKLDEPHKDEKGRTLGWTLEQVQALRVRLGVAPYQRNAITAAIQNQKGGCWKTASTVHIGDDLGIRGHRVVIIDADPQSSYTLHRGIIPDLDLPDSETIYPFLVGERPPEEILQVVRETRNPNVHFVPGCLSVAGSAEKFGALFAQILERMKLRVGVNEHGDPRVDEQGRSEIMLLFSTLDRTLDYLRPHYDVILIDGTPFLGVLAINILSAADYCITPCPTELPDFASTVRFVGMLADYFDSAIDFCDDDLNLPDLVVLPTRFNSTPTNLNLDIHDKIQRLFVDPQTGAHHYLHPAVEKHDAVVGRTFDRHASAFDLPIKNNKKLEIDRRALVRAVSNLTGVTDDILKRVFYPHWRALAQEDGAQGYDPLDLTGFKPGKGEQEFLDNQLAHELSATEN